MYQTGKTETDGTDSKRTRHRQQKQTAHEGYRIGPQTRSKKVKIPETSVINVLYPHVGVCRSFRSLFNGASCLRSYSTSFTYNRSRMQQRHAPLQKMKLKHTYMYDTHRRYAADFLCFFIRYVMRYHACKPDNDANHMSRLYTCRLYKTHKQIAEKTKSDCTENGTQWHIPRNDRPQSWPAHARLTTNPQQ